jgi:hypothetical protein
LKLSSAFPILDAAMRPQVHLIAIGANAAPHQQPLPFAEANVASIAALFTSGRGFVSPSNAHVLLGRNATTRALDDAIAAVPAGVFLIVYAMLHGGQPGLALADGTFYPHERLRRRLATTRARGVLMLLDSCHAGLVVGGLGGMRNEADWLDLMIRSVPGFRYILASSAAHTTFWSSSYGGGLYTWALNEAAKMIAPGDLGREDQFVSAALLFERICEVAPPGLSPIADGPLSDIPLLRANDRVIGAANLVGFAAGRDFGAVARVIMSGRRGMAATVTATAFDDLGLLIATSTWEVTTTTAIDGATLTYALDLAALARSPIASQQLFHGKPIVLTWHVAIADDEGRNMGVWTVELGYELAASRLRAAGARLAYTPDD